MEHEDPSTDIEYQAHVESKIEFAAWQEPRDVELSNNSRYKLCVVPFLARTILSACCPFPKSMILSHELAAPKFAKKVAVNPAEKFKVLGSVPKVA